MAKRKQQPRRQGGKGRPAWAWLLAGLLIGAMGFIAYRQYLSISADPAPEVPVPQAADADKGDEAAANAEPAASSGDDGVLDTDYSFYDVLPTEQALDAPATADADGTQTATPAAAPAPATTTAAEPVAAGGRYLLQAGAFERAADADDQKARIALSGEAARVEMAEVNGKTVYRVRLGPYADAQAANAAKANLAGQGIETVSIKIQP